MGWNTLNTAIARGGLLNFAVQLLLSAPCPALQQELPVAEDSAAGGRFSIVPLPVLYYTPETGVAGGAAALASYRSDTSDRTELPSSTLFDIVYTEKRQIIAELIPDLYFQHSALNVVGSIRYLDYPDKFFGIGNTTPDSYEELYTSRYFEISSDIRWRLWGNFSAGISLSCEHRTLSDFQKNGLLSSGSVFGTGGGTTFGFGAAGRWDSRDNIFSPTQGWFAQAVVRHSGRNILSDFDFTYFTMDVRWYFPVTDHSSFASEIVATTTAGLPPFYMLAELGGENIMRGYYLGRYRDRKLLAGQGEYRFPIYWRIRGAAFAGLGDVASTMAGFNLHDVKCSGGLGLRYVLDADEGMTIRVDLGFGRRTSGLYITFNEAF